MKGPDGVVQVRRAPWKRLAQASKTFESSMPTK